MDIVPGTTLVGRYQVVRALGSGAMGNAWLVTDLLWRTQLSLKTIRSGSHAHALRREFAVLASLAHPSLLRVHDLGCPWPQASAPLWFYTADFIDGVPLLQAARGQRWPFLRSAVLPCLEAVRVLHRAGIRHGDIKPSHVLVPGDGHAVLLDFGCAGPLVQPAQTHVSGTHGFLAPELLAGHASDQRADLFALGVTLARTVEVLASPPPVAVRRLITRLRAPDPADRPSGVDEVLEALGSEPARLSPALDCLGRLAGRDREVAQARAWVRHLAARTSAPRFLHVTGPRGVGRTRFLQEIKWDAEQLLTVVEAHPMAPGSLPRALRLALHDDQLTIDLPSVLDAADRLEKHDMASTLLVLDDFDGFTAQEREVLTGLARSLPASSRLGILSAECTGAPVADDGVEGIALLPLAEGDLVAWLSPRLDDSAIHDLHARTLGFPSRVAAVLGMRASLHPSLAERPTALAPELARALAVLEAMDGVVADTDVEGLSLERESLQSLAAQGLIARDGFLWKLGGHGGAGEVEAAAGAEALGASRAQVASYLMVQARRRAEEEPSQASRTCALAVRQFARSGDQARAAAEAMQHEAWHALAPADWAKALGLLADGGDPAISMQAARCELEAGQTRQGIERLEELARRSKGRMRSEANLEAGLGHARAAEHTLAIERFAEVLADVPDAALRARACDAMARSCVRLGRCKEAAEWAAQGLALGPGASLEAALLCSAGIAFSYLGDERAAEQHLRAAADRLGPDTTPAERVRILGSMGVHAYRAGSLSDAAQCHRQALAVAREYALHASIATAALNLGTVLHQQGAFLEASEAYQQGLHLAVALAQHGTQAWLLYDLAKLQADVGQLDRARHTAERCAAVASRIHNEVAAAAADAVLGELDSLQGNPQRGLERLARARDLYAAQDSRWEQLELELQLAEVRLVLGNPQEAAQRVAAATALMAHDDSASPDLRVRFAIVEARLQLADGRPEDASVDLESALGTARDVGLRDAEAEVHSLLATAWQLRGAPALARGSRDRAREIWERLAAAFPPSDREAFWRHPRRASTSQDTTVEPHRGESTAESRLRLLLQINKRLNSSLQSEEVLRRAMDAAIDLTGAERGFLVLRSESGDLRVAVARNVDQEQIARSHLKFSRSIAARVIETREPVVTTDAQSDERFRGEESVHAMSLQSVLCVPVESPSGVLGALYLDNRFSRGRFHSDDAGLLLAFADQVAIALTNARLHAELERRNQQLEEERKRVEALAAGQSVQIDRLQEEVRQTRRGLGRRHEFGQILGTSAAMQRALEVLDRVVDTPVPVLIEGESGTGKELFARALHEHGARRDRPFVAINCGAMPELLLESELFGHERGAFTGADRAREGLMVMCRGGTLFLDEIGEMPASMQVKLLRVLQEREVRPLGSSANVPVDFRLVSATNRKLQEEVRRGAFREDLYYRISTVLLRVPSLRERLEDLPVLSDHLLNRACESVGKPAAKLSRAALKKLAAHTWPGNVRQLENVLVNAVVMSDGERIEADDLDLQPAEAPPDMRAGRRGFEQEQVQHIVEVLRAHRWNVTRALPELGISRATLYRLLKRHGVARK